MSITQILRYNRLYINHIKFSDYFVRGVSKCPAEQENKFETVYSLPSIKYIAILNRLKVYHFIGSSVALPLCGLLEVVNIVPHSTFLSTAYVGLTAGAVLSLVTWPFHNVIGFLYISEDNNKIKISSVDFWGKRKDSIINTDDWIPLLELPPKTMDAVYLTPQLTNGTKYKLLIKFGKVFNSNKIGKVLE
ncbi:transmembrane protein 186 [Plodia interpunctella]|uniref:transmembrane protein 186 n=1 Tax=Plodia interpunctella TaxID=58824 RepID=UPI002368243A|nr:transmembrane protein 186 [Plodia interpunctella]